MAKTALELTREEWKQYNPLRPRQELVDEKRGVHVDGKWRVRRPPYCANRTARRRSWHSARWYMAKDSLSDPIERLAFADFLEPHVEARMDDEAF